MVNVIDDAMTMVNDTYMFTVTIGTAYRQTSLSNYLTMANVRLTKVDTVLVGVGQNLPHLAAQ